MLVVITDRSGVDYAGEKQTGQICQFADIVAGALIKTNRVRRAESEERDRYRAAVEAGSLPVYADGYGQTTDTPSEGSEVDETAGEDVEEAENTPTLEDLRPFTDDRFVNALDGHGFTLEGVRSVLESDGPEGLEVVDGIAEAGAKSVAEAVEELDES